MGMLREFRDFAARGNVIDLAVGVIIGAAFGKIVDSVVKDLINPIVGIVVGKPDFTDLYWVIKAPVQPLTGPQTYEALTAAGATVFGYGAFLTVLVQFLLLAAAIFLLVRFINKARVAAQLAPEAAPAAPPPPTPEDILLLREIRDSLKR